MRWLKENGRLPSADIDEYFEEIKSMKEAQSELKALKEQQVARNNEIKAF